MQFLVATESAMQNFISTKSILQFEVSYAQLSLVH